MKNFKAVGKKVYLPELKKTGTALKTDAQGNVILVEIDGDIVDTTNKIVQLWELLSWFYRVVLSIFSKKN